MGEVALFAERRERATDAETIGGGETAESTERGVHDYWVE